MRVRRLIARPVRGAVDDGALHALAQAERALNASESQLAAVIDAVADAIVTVDGWVNMSKEQLNLHVKPETKQLRLLTFRTPFYVEGTFKHPDLSLDKKVLAMKGGAAAVLAAVAAPVAALLPLINTGPGENSPCAALLAKARAPASAPPPGQSAKH